MTIASALARETDSIGLISASKVEGSACWDTDAIITLLHYNPGMDELPLNGPVLNSAGTLGFVYNPRLVGGPPPGAFITAPVSRQARSPSAGHRLVAFPGEFLIHTGLPNPGLRAVIHKYAERWEKSPIPVIVHLIGENPDDVHQMVLQLEEVDGVQAIELGLPPDADGKTTSALVQAASGELPVIAQLPLMTGHLLAASARDAGAAGLSLSAPRGRSAGADKQSFTGRIYGPAVYPLMLAALDKLLGLGLPVLAGGGIERIDQILEVLNFGASAVQLDYALWRDREFIALPSP